MKALLSPQEGGKSPSAYERLTPGDRAVIAAGMHGVDVSVWIAYQIVRQMQRPEAQYTQEQYRQHLGADAFTAAANSVDQAFSDMGYTAINEPTQKDFDLVVE